MERISGISEPEWNHNDSGSKQWWGNHARTTEDAYNEFALN